MNTKRILILLLLALAGVPGSAQHFEWVRSYSGTDRPSAVDNRTVKSLTDADGNLYTLGCCSPNAMFANVELCPIRQPYANCLLMTKLSPRGDLLWHKVIASTAGHMPLDMKRVSDTSIMYMATFSLHSPLYYLDTLLTETDNYPVPTDTVGDIDVTTAFITLDSAGNLLEHHFMQASYIDNDGKVVTTDRLTNNPRDSNMILLYPFDGAFSLDNEGNIFVARFSNDRGYLHCDTCETGLKLVSVENGLLSGIRYYLDGRPFFSICPDNRPAPGNSILMKFAPHFDSVIGWRYLLAEEGGTFEGNTLNGLALEVADDGSVFVREQLQLFRWLEDTATAVVHGTEDVNVTFSGGMDGMVIKCDNDCNPLYVIKINPVNAYPDYTMDYMDVKEDSSFLFLTGNALGFETDSFELQDGTPLDIAARAFLMVFDRADGGLVGHSKVNSSRASGIGTSEYDIDTWNNRVFAPVKYYTDLQFGNTTINITPNNIASAVCVFDYSANPIGVIEIVGESNNHNVYSVSGRDSVLYIMGTTHINLTFGDVQLQGCGSGASTAYFAKYVDTSFTHLYVPSSSAIPGREAPARRLRVYPNPSGGAAVSVQGEGVGAIGRADAFGSDGRAYALPVVGGRLLVGALPAGGYTLVVRTLDNRVFNTKFIKL